ncbi:hypothetical protein JH06_5569 [Blastocystis sp. subtype 4]|uniref:hypothetical protein n=1 Tax=Blastocystis sp. subtype 4 TaxID=944170 RepID=UPI00071154A6|nr:hypothetical protein JH06_5569 [Blastocystis sp. subtype 4]KNB43313.1 hypothetical protein JH06_5569 [Blastocystis sp. subtype 4]|eukprot:XP_014526756.1 hypothetical protein JH06_5569 [Blastocystis sp. subtype 4]
MIEYDVNGMRVYEGGFEGDMMKGFVREGEGKEYGNDGKSALYVGGWKNGLREGYGSEFKGYSALYVGEWKNGMRDGKGKELNENEEVIRSGKWIKGEYEGATKRFEDGYGNDDVDCLKGIGRLKIGNDCFKKVNRFVIDGLNELKSVNIGWNSFKLNKENRCGSKCLIMNCDQLSEIHIGGWSFFWYESFELKNLRSLISIQLDQYAFMKCHSIVFENLTRLQSITLGYAALLGNDDNVESNELIMKNLPSLSIFKGVDYNFICIGKVILENIPSLPSEGIQMGRTFWDVIELHSSSMLV